MVGLGKLIILYYVYFVDFLLVLFVIIFVIIFGKKFLLRFINYKIKFFCFEIIMNLICILLEISESRVRKSNVSGICKCFCIGYVKVI